MQLVYVFSSPVQTSGAGHAPSICSSRHADARARDWYLPLQRMPDKLGLKPYVVHATFQASVGPIRRSVRAWVELGLETSPADTVARARAPQCLTSSA